MNKTYRVSGGDYANNKFDNLAEARQRAEAIMAGRHDGDYVMIEVMEDGEDFFEPYGRIVRRNGKFVLE